MKHRILFSLALLSALSAASHAATQVGVSIGINQPGVYGRIDIGAYPQPAIVLPQPVVVQPAPVVIQRQPIYLYVPVAHQRDWARYCARYAACGQPVYFVQEQWVRERYAHEHPGWRGREGREGREHDRGRHEGRDRDHDRH